MSEHKLRVIHKVMHRVFVLIGMFFAGNFIPYTYLCIFIARNQIGFYANLSTAALRELSTFYVCMVN